MHLMNHMSFGKDEYTMGKSKIFIANPNTVGGHRCFSCSDGVFCVDFEINLSN